MTDETIRNVSESEDYDSHSLKSGNGVIQKFLVMEMN